MKLKPLAAAIALALSAVGASAADQVINAGTLPIAPNAPWATVITHGAGETFFDSINFDIAAGMLISSANPLNLVLGSLTMFNITNLSYELWDGHHPGGIISYGSFSGNNTTNSIALTAPGLYHIDITGTADGLAGGAYGVSLQTAAVPEPETYAMFVAGLGALGFMARRRRLQG